MKKDLVLFLDFDGVLHHSPKIKEKTDEENDVFFFTNNLESMCEELSSSYNLKIVFSTTWKKKFSFEDLKGFFEDYPSINKSCYDITPNIMNIKDEGSKFKEASLWLNSNDYNGKFIVLDDLPQLWVNENNELPQGFIKCENQFSKNEMIKIRKHLSDGLIKKPKIR